MNMLYKIGFRGRRLQTSSLSLACAAALLLAMGACAAPSDGVNTALVARTVARLLPELHLNRGPLDDETAHRALHVYLNSLDHDHSFFLADDIALFEKDAAQLDDELREGNVEAAFRIYDQFLKRASNRVAFASEILDEEIDTSVPETYAWKRREAPWPRDEAEWNDLWRRKVKNDYVARLVSLRLAEEEKAASTNNATAESEGPSADESPSETMLTPEEFVFRRYKQFLTLMRENDSEWVLQRYLSSFAQAYDPHSDYLSANTTEDFNITMKRSLEGIGATLTTEDGMAKIASLIPGGPAERDGRLKPGDRIIAVGQGDEPPVDTLHWPLNKVVQKIRGKKGTKVLLRFLPASDISGAAVKTITLVRDEVRLEERAAKSRVVNTTNHAGRVYSLGIITVPDFYTGVRDRSGVGPDGVANDVRRILGELEKQEVAGILMDLRNDGGGALDESVELTGLFLPSGPVVQVKDRRAVQMLSDTDPETVYAGPLVVLVNRLSASASEIVAGALQDYRRAVIVGDSRTHGKGTVQTLLPLNRWDPSLGTLRVTIATFYRVAGGSTQIRGVTPDIVLPSAFDKMEIGEEYLPHVLPWSSITPSLYKPREDLGPTIKRLQEWSNERQVSEPSFEAHRALLQRLEERFATAEISLQLEERLRLATSEREMERVQSSPSPDAEKKENKHDPVLAEALRILADLVSETVDKESAATASTH